MFGKTTSSKRAPHLEAACRIIILEDQLEEALRLNADKPGSATRMRAGNRRG